MTTMGHLSVWRWKDVLLGAVLFCNFDIYCIFIFFPFCLFVSLCFATSYQRLLMKQNVKWSQFFISDRTPPSPPPPLLRGSVLRCLCTTYLHTYFRWLVPLTVIQWQEKHASPVWFLMYLSRIYDIKQWHLYIGFVYIFTRQNRPNPAMISW